MEIYFAHKMHTWRRNILLISWGCFKWCDENDNNQLRGNKHCFCCCRFCKPKTLFSSYRFKFVINVSINFAKILLSSTQVKCDHKTRGKTSSFKSFVSSEIFCCCWWTFSAIDYEVFCLFLCKLQLMNNNFASHKTDSLFVFDWFSFLFCSLFDALNFDCWKQ